MKSKLSIAISSFKKLIPLPFNKFAKNTEKVTNMPMYDNENTVRTTFDLNYINEYLIQAQWAEFIELKKVIHEISERQKSPITILDIGIGNARVPKHLS